MQMKYIFAILGAIASCYAQDRRIDRWETTDKFPFVLVINDGDESFPSQCGLTTKQFDNPLSEDRLIHIFAQNCDLQAQHPKITPIPNKTL